MEGCRVGQRDSLNTDNDVGEVGVEGPGKTTPHRMARPADHLGPIPRLASSQPSGKAFQGILW